MTIPGAVGSHELVCIVNAQSEHGHSKAAQKLSITANAPGWRIGVWGAHTKNERKSKAEGQLAQTVSAMVTKRLN